LLAIIKSKDIILCRCRVIARTKLKAVYLRIFPHKNGVSIKTPCKVNPFLEVLQRRDDGYHELDTAMIAIDLCDELTFVPSSSRENQLAVSSNSPWICNQIGYNGEALGDVRKNLVWKALELLALELNPRFGLDASLRKSIPIQAGLGGGSSDAAAALVAGQWLWSGHVDASLTSRLAAKLGSDVNFFVDGFLDGVWSARCTGRGELVQPTAISNHTTWVIVTPKQGCETANVFRHLSLGLGERPADQIDWTKWLVQFQSGGSLFNRLLQPAMDAYPALDDFFNAVDASDGISVSLSGSGSSLVATGDRDELIKWSSMVAKTLDCFVHVGGVWRTDSIQQQLDRLETGSLR
jgi:4-diphosphocytidyl-2-C-methyl-D-erythritol kinase